MTGNYSTSKETRRVRQQSRTRAGVQELIHLVHGDLLANLLEVSLGEDETDVSLQSVTAAAPN